MINSVRAYAVSALCILASCGSTQSDPSLLSEAFKRVNTQDDPTPAPTLAQIKAGLSPAVLARFNGPVMIAQLPSRNAVALLSKVGTNQGVDTFLSTDGISISISNGVIVATRGFGFDLMRADYAEPLLAIKNPPQEIARNFSHLDGENQLITTTYDCSYATIGARQVKEVCTSSTQSFENTHSLDENGEIFSATQWVSLQTGPIVFEIIQ